MSESNRTNTASNKNTYCYGSLETGSLPVVGAINHLNNKDMIIGTDVSLATCKAEGYLMIEYDGRKKFDRKKYYRAFWYWPEYDDKAGELAVDTLVCFDDLVEKYTERKSDLDAFSETGTRINFDAPKWCDLLNLASDIDSYMGLD